MSFQMSYDLQFTSTTLPNPLEAVNKNLRKLSLTRHRKRRKWGLVAKQKQPKMPMAVANRMIDEPNINMFPLESAENGVNQAIRSVCEIAPTDDSQMELKNMVTADLKELQDGNMLALRRAIE